MKRQALFFQEPGRVEVVEEDVPNAGEHQYLIRTLLTAVSAGTEMLFYRGQVPPGMSVDASIAGMTAETRYPLKYGYCCVGEVVDARPGTDPGWLGRKVFAFHPHESLFWALANELILLEDETTTERAVFLPNMETALNLVQDTAPLVGETIGVWGLGVIGQLTTALLAQFPLAALIGFDPKPLRRAVVENVEGVATIDPQIISGAESLRQLPGLEILHGLDACLEVSGVPAALNQAIACCGYAGRVVIGSWYGVKPARLDLGGEFHRSRLRLVSSQVSTIAPELRGRWDKARRIDETLRQLERIRPERLISHRFPFEKASDVYRLLEEAPDEVIQVVFEY
jgi:2-desacetyl-2-hydroxyethyl bacteriochlorophyllide A dehydrogenase